MNTHVFTKEDKQKSFGDKKIIQFSDQLLLYVGDILLTIRYRSQPIKNVYLLSMITTRL